MKGAREVRSEVLEKIESDQLKIFVVWTPAYPGDSRDKAEKAASTVADERATHFWDGARKLGDRYREVLNLPERVHTAWDVYFAFDRSAEWKEIPPKPDVWMHQLSGVGKDQRLNGDKLRLSVQGLLSVRSVEKSGQKK